MHNFVSSCTLDFGVRPSVHSGHQKIISHFGWANHLNNCAIKRVFLQDVALHLALHDQIDIHGAVVHTLVIVHDWFEQMHYASWLDHFSCRIKSRELKMIKHLDLKSFWEALKESFHVQHQDQSYQRSTDVNFNPSYEEFQGLRVVQTQTILFLKCRESSDSTWNDSEIGFLDRRQMTPLKSRVVLCRTRLFPTMISKMKWVWSALPLKWHQIKRQLKSLIGNESMTPKRNPLCSNGSKDKNPGGSMTSVDPWPFSTSQKYPKQLIPYLI